MVLKNKTRNLFMLLIVFLFSSIIFVGCDKAKETVEEETDKMTEKTNELISETAEKVETVTEKITDEVGNVVANNFLVGTWSGKFDGRKTILTFTKQEGNNFQGKITINYRNVINQEVKGVYDPEKNIITMEDQLHSRYRGKYYGKLSEENSVYSGEFTMKLDGKKFNFILKKN